jgi:Tfp pilus assembly protein PilV
VHRNAQLAVIGVALVGVQVRNLRYGQQSQQDQAHCGHHRQKADATAPPETLRPEA